MKILKLRKFSKGFLEEKLQLKETLKGIAACEL